MMDYVLLAFVSFFGVFGDVSPCVAVYDGLGVGFSCIVAHGGYVFA